MHSPIHLQHELSPRRVNGLLLLAGGCALNLNNEQSMLRMPRNDVRAAELRMCPNSDTYVLESRFSNACTHSFFGFVLATLCTFHSVNIDTNAPALTGREAVCYEPALYFKLIHGMTFDCMALRINHPRTCPSPSTTHF